MRAEVAVLCKAQGLAPEVALHGPETIDDYFRGIEYARHALEMHSFGVRAQLRIDGVVVATLMEGE